MSTSVSPHRPGKTKHALKSALPNNTGRIMMRASIDVFQLKNGLTMKNVLIDATSPIIITKGAASVMHALTFGYI